MLLSANYVEHTIPIDTNFDAGSLTSGNEQADQRFMHEYMAFHQTLAGLTRDYSKVKCQCQSNGTALYLHLYCY